MDILGLSTSPSSGGAYALILNEPTANRRLPIIIGTFEAQAIALELENIKPPRPMTHDLLKEIIKSFDTQVKQIVINELKEGTFYAQIHYDYEGHNVELDARPSDAIALAIRFKAPIFVEKSIIEEAGITAEHEQSTGTAESAMQEPATSAEGSPNPENKMESLEKQLSTAIEKEDYEKAAKLRDEIERIKKN